MVESTPTGRRGRRGGGADTKATLLAAAKAVFAELGYDNATVRTIATRAGVDPAMVNHWFGGKQGLFVRAVLELPFDPADLRERLLGDGHDDSHDDVAERMVRQFVTVWDGEGGGQLAALMRSITHQPQAAQALRELFVSQVFVPLLAELGVDDAPLRASLCASQMLGLGMVRYVLRFEPIASADVETVVATIAPNMARYLTGDLGQPPSSVLREQ